MQHVPFNAQVDHVNIYRNPKRFIGGPPSPHYHSFSKNLPWDSHVTRNSSSCPFPAAGQVRTKSQLVLRLKTSIVHYVSYKNEDFFFFF